MKKTINNYKNIIRTLGYEPSKEQQISLHYQRQATNQMQISYITKKKIHQILENTGDNYKSDKTNPPPKILYSD